MIFIRQFYHLSFILPCVAVLLFDSGLCKVLASHDIFNKKKTYQLTNEPIDVVFITHPKDLRTLPLAINGIKTHGKNIRRIIVVSEQKLTEDAEWFDENLYPFSKEAVALEIFNNDWEQMQAYMDESQSRIGWIYQQFLKLYAPFVIPGLSSSVLVIDADTIFLKETEFIDNDGHALFNPGTEYHMPYFEHAKRLLPGFKKLYLHYSGISHHMLLQRAILEDLLGVIEQIHGIEPWRAIARCIDLKELPGSSMSEYEIYFNFAFSKTDQVKLRPLKWANVSFGDFSSADDLHKKYDYVSCHSYECINSKKANGSNKYRRNRKADRSKNLYRSNHS